MKTIAQALMDEIPYPLGTGFIENKLIARGIDGDMDFSQEVANSRGYKGAWADCLYALLYSPNFSEADKNISLSEKNLIIRKINALYSSIGEEPEGLTNNEVEVIHI